MKRRAGTAIFLLPGTLLLLGTALALPSHAASLKGSKASVVLQKNVADAHGFTSVRTPAQIRQFVSMGLLVPVSSTPHMEIDGEVSYPVARPELKRFLESFAERYHTATGEKLVVTSLTRPLTRQPRNASGYSVHPAGIAVDIRRSNNGKARSWIERELTQLESRGILDATRERRPPHYHVAIFPNAYRDYENGGASSAPVTDLAQAAPKPPTASKIQNSPGTGSRLASATVSHRVRKGENLWTIARRYGTSVSRLKTMNNVGSTIFPGQVLTVPASP